MNNLPPLFVICLYENAHQRIDAWFKNKVHGAAYKCIAVTPLNIFHALRGVRNRTVILLDCILDDLPYGFDPHNHNVVIEVTTQP